MTARSQRSSGRLAADSDIVDVVPPARGARKQRTRDALIDAALSLMNEGRSFNSLGLREITRVAGVVPTSFYRHFRDTSELGLVLVEESTLTLRRMLREARLSHIPAGDMTRRSVQVYTEFVLANRLHFLFISGERHGGSPIIRNAIRDEVEQFITEMTQDLEQTVLFPKLTPEAARLICGLVVNTMLNAANDILDLPPDAPDMAKTLEDTFVKQVCVIFLGAQLWKEQTARQNSVA